MDRLDDAAANLRIRRGGDRRRDRGVGDGAATAARGAERLRMWEGAGVWVRGARSAVEGCGDRAAGNARPTGRRIDRGTEHLFPDACARADASSQRAAHREAGLPLLVHERGREVHGLLHGDGRAVSVADRVVPGGPRGDGRRGAAAGGGTRRRGLAARERPATATRRRRHADVGRESGRRRADR